MVFHVGTMSQSYKTLNFYDLNFDLKSRSTAAFGCCDFDSARYGFLKTGYQFAVPICRLLIIHRPSKFITMKSSIANPTTVSVRYIVDDVDSSVKFYTQMLGFDVVMHTPAAFAMLSKGNLHLLLNKPGAGGAGQAMPDGATPIPGGWNRFHLEVRGLESVINELKSKNVKFRNEVVTAPAGKQILLIDPSGNLVELFERTQ
jgi:catechol 2,3-dioxygenase-like lactoylglutathione lyase family enzyme